ncbi:DUF2306 domain-containing protein [uncultured Roseibium sp.]|uniref:DUF2306 domain-containing protein n=1 Tax=uncultured Roseibium sp. TaxID=1936171 RepID=UPI003217C3AB
MARNIRLNRVGRWGAAVACVAIALLSYRFALFGVQESMAYMAHHLETGRVLFYAHIALAPVALAIVPFQLSSRLRRKLPAVHRWVGRLYVFVIFLSGIAGFRIAFNTAAGPVAASGFALLGVIWLGVTTMGLVHGIRRNFVQHRAWMLRSVALTFAAVTLRLYLGAVMSMGLPFEIFYPAIAWLCWVPNAVVMELYLRRRGTFDRKRMAAA